MEIWRPVFEYEGHYEVSDQGRLRRISLASGVRLDAIRKPSRRPQGYLNYTLSLGNVQRAIAAHRLVWEAFNGPIKSWRIQVNHKNGDKTDNRLVNLELCSASQNAIHARRVLGVISIPPKPMPGSKHPNSLIVESDVLKIREMFSSGESQTKIAAAFGIHQTTVSDIVRRKRWRHV